VDRRQPAANNALDIGAMAAELNQTLGLVCSAHLRSDPRYAHLPPDLTELRHVALSGDGEPTLSPRFAEAVRTIVRLRAQLEFPYFKLVLVTNASGLDQPEVKESLKLFDSDDEVWAKLDAGSHEYFDRINVPHISLSRVMGNILMLAQLRPVVIQSLFPLMDGEEPSANEIRAYVGRLQELTAAGAMISLVQVYSASRPIGNARCGHLRLRTLSRIAKLIRSQTGLPAEVF
jgi:wyosine [tRNA(Phe)-imidazoG37] synthetase (radical SAM superfamily)